MLFSERINHCLGGPAACSCSSGVEDQTRCIGKAGVFLGKSLGTMGNVMVSFDFTFFLSALVSVRVSVSLLCICVCGPLFHFQFQHMCFQSFQRRWRQTGGGSRRGQFRDRCSPPSLANNTSALSGYACAARSIYTRHRITITTPIHWLRAPLSERTTPLLQSLRHTNPG